MATLKWQIKSYDVGIAQAGQLEVFIPTYLQLSDLTELKRLFEHATSFGSLIQVPEELAKKLTPLKKLSEATSQLLFVSEALKSLGALVQRAELLVAQYDAVVANPPYMGGGGMNSLVKKFAKNQFPDAKSDLFACFFERCLTFSNALGRLGLVAPYVWMFLSSYAKFRAKLLDEASLAGLIQLEYNAFEPACIPVATFILMRQHVKRFVGTYIKLSEFKGHQNQAPKVLEAIGNPDCHWLYEATPDDFKKIPGSPVAYWVSDAIRNAFVCNPRLGDLSTLTYGMFSCDHERFLRRWFEIDSAKMRHPRNEGELSQRYCLYNKGGRYRKWAGNCIYVVDYAEEGDVIRRFRSEQGQSYSLPGEKWFFKEGVTWSAVTSGAFSARIMPAGYVFDKCAPAAFFEQSGDSLLVMGLLNSHVMGSISKLLNPTLSFNLNDLEKVPLAWPVDQRFVADMTAKAIDVSQSDWDSFETSWDFRSLPLLTASTEPTPSLESSHSAWVAQCKNFIDEMKRLEEENNRLFIDAYGLHDELTPDVPIDQITLTVNPSYRYGGDLTKEEKWERFQRDSMAEFLSYAIGCMMGRYSLDQPGLILADSGDSQPEQLTAYEEKVGKPLSEVQFEPDPDGIIPVLDGEWFEDDIVARTREFLSVTFPESSVGENLRFIEESLGKDIRKYFCTEFYKDHLQTYKKRPIYWMVQSPKKGFACLIYLHRYTKDTLNQVLNNYFRPYLQKLEARLAQLGLDQLNDSLPTRERTAARKEAEKITKVLKECQAWEQDALLPLAQQRIELDLDDGVKVNYLKLQDVLAPIPGLAAKED